MHLILKDGRRNLNQQMDFEKRKSVLESIEKYYITNEGKEETIDNEEAICERIRILKKEK